MKLVGDGDGISERDQFFTCHICGSPARFVLLLEVSTGKDQTVLPFNVCKQHVKTMEKKKTFIMSKKFLPETQDYWV